MLEPEIVAQLLAVYPVLHDVPATVQHAVRQHAAPVHAAPGDVVFDVGTHCHVLPLVMRGSVRVIQSLASGRELMLYRVQPGEACILTVGCLLGGARYNARGVVDEPLCGVALPRPLFSDMIVHAPAFRAFVFQFFNWRLNTLLGLIDEVGFGRLDARLAAALLDKGNPAVVTHQALADELGTAREVVSRILKQMADAGWVRLGRGRIHIVDPRQLARLAG